MWDQGDEGVFVSFLFFPVQWGADAEFLLKEETPIDYSVGEDYFSFYSLGVVAVRRAVVVAECCPVLEA